MKERIRELANGQVEYRMPEFTVQPENIEGRLNIDGLHRTEVLIEVENLIQVKGVAYSSHSRVHVVHPTFFGRRCSISLEINTVGLSGQGMIEGVLTLVTNAGCREIPYSFRMQEKGYGVEERVIRTIEDFADFALEDEKGALRLFKSRNFTGLSFMHDIKRLAFYQALQAERDERKNLEEFLVCSGAKESLSYEIVSEPLKLTGMQQGDQQLVISKNTWGYGVLHISADRPFLVPLKQAVTTDDFKADESGRGTLNIPFAVMQEHLASGLNEGSIIVKSAKGELRFPVSVYIEETVHYSDSARLRAKKVTAQLMAGYIAYRTACMDDAQDERQELKKLVDLTKKAVQEYPEDWEKKLVLIYFHLLSGRPDEADRYLDEVRDEVMKNRIANTRAYCFFLYLRALFNNSDEQMDTAAKLITKYYTENDQDPELMLLLLKTDSAYRENQSLSVLRLKELYMDGCNSPLLYLDACENYRKCPDLLRVLNDFELQTMYFGARKGILSEELAVTAAKVSSYENRFKPFTLRLLSNIYQKYPKKEILESICGYLIRCSCKTEEYFCWYEQGVKSALTIVGLNEAYLNALPGDWKKPLPQALLLYFAYSQDLRDDVKEVLYENILLYYDENTQIYREYAEQMEEYALTQLLAGRISRKLVPLYRHLVLQEMIDERLAAVLPDLLMAYEITCRNPELVRVIIRCPELNYEDTYTLENGVCCAPIYTEDSLVMFIDAYGNRYSDVPYEKELLFAQPELLTRCEEVYPDHLIFMIKKCMARIGKPLKDAADLELMNRVLASAEVSPFLKTRLISRMLDYYLSQNERVSDAFLMNLDIPSLSYHDRRKALECMVHAGHLSEVYAYISQNSVNGLKYESLLKLAEYRLKELRGELEQYLLDLCLYLFSKDVYTMQLLAYLCRYYNGPDAQMRRLLFSCREKGVPVSDLPERVIGQMLFAGDLEELREVYAAYKASPDVKETVQRAYIVTCCYQYFVNDLLIDENVFVTISQLLFDEDTRDLLRAEYEENDIVNIALLYYLTKNENVFPEQNRICERLLGRLCKRGLLFGFYSLLWSKVAFPAELNGKFLLEHRSHNAGRVFLTMKRTGMDDAVTVQMQKMYDGIFVSQVVLFADETLEYSVSEEHDGVLRVVVERELMANDMAFVRSGSTFETINEFGRLFAAGQEKLLEDALVRYETKQHITAELFKPL